MKPGDLAWFNTAMIPSETRHVKLRMRGNPRFQSIAQAEKETGCGEFSQGEIGLVLARVTDEDRTPYVMLLANMRIGWLEESWVRELSDEPG